MRLTQRAEAYDIYLFINYTIQSLNKLTLLLFLNYLNKIFYLISKVQILDHLRKRNSTLLIAYFNNN